MSVYDGNIYESIWLLENWNGSTYRIMKNLNNKYQVFYEDDINEVSSGNYIVKKDHKIINGKFAKDEYYFEAQDNFLHSTTNFAICCPCGLDVYKPNIDVFHYILCGKIVTTAEWFEKLPKNKYWLDAIANKLGTTINYNNLPN